MNYRMVAFVLGRIFAIEAGLMLFPLICAMLYGEWYLLPAFLLPAALLAVLGFITSHKTPKNTTIFARDGLAIVALVWVLMSAFGALPFVISGEIPSFIDAFFETVSGFTTTGSTILTDVEALSHGTLYWRSFSHWVGGMGVLVFAMAVLERPLARVYPEIDMVTTPTGRPVAMVHCNTCTSDLDAWVRVLGEMAGAAGAKLEKPRLYDLFYQKALEGEADCGGLVSYNYYSGEPVTGVESGRPLFMRRPDARFTLANFARVQLYAAMATLKLGMDILLVEEGVRLDTLLGHGGLFKTPVAGQKLLAGALGVPVAVMETAGEGGPWGMALLAAYCVRRAEGQTLEEYLADTVFRGAQGSVQQPDAADTAGFARFLTDYKSGLAVEKAAAAALR